MLAKLKTMRKQVSIIIVVVIALTLVAPVRSLAVDVGGKEITSRGACVIDFETGITLFGYEADTLRVPASMTKLIAVYVVYDGISAGEISLDTVTQISSKVSELSNNWEYSNVPFSVGMSVTIRELLDVVIVWSACGATVALGEALCGSEAAFITRMNEKVANLGIDAHFYDCYGVSASNRISPSGMANLARNLIIDHPEILEITSKRSVSFRGTEYKNTNQLLGDYSGIDGIKTGYTDAAGYCFTGTARRDGRRIIAVTMGSTAISRFPDVRILFDYGFAVADSVIADYNRIDTAYPSGANLILNGESMPLNAYLIGGSHYFKLRDIAFLLQDTKSRFDVTWDRETGAVKMITGVSYPYNGNIQGDVGEETRKCSLSPSQFFLDDEEYMLEAYLIGGNNYFKLRDLGELLCFDVDWEEATRTVILDTNPAVDIADPEAPDPEASDPEIADPDAEDPEAADPTVIDPTIIDPETADPKAIDPGAADPDKIEAVFITYAGAVTTDFTEPVGAKIPLHVWIEPAGLAPDEQIVWTSSDERVFKVAADNPEGTAATVTIIGSGTAKSAILTVKIGAVQAECIVRVAAFRNSSMSGTAIDLRTLIGKSA